MQQGNLLFTIIILFNFSPEVNGQRFVSQKMDSAIIKKNNGNGQLGNYYKTVYSYNSQGLDTVENKYNFTLNSWVLDIKMIFNYDSSGNLTEETQLNWDQASSSLVNRHTKNWTFDANNNMESYTYAYWVDSISTWREIVRHYYIYDSNTLLSQKTMLNFDESNNVWVNYHRESYWYNPNQKLDSLLLQVGSNWADQEYITYQYNSMNLLIASQEQRFINGSFIPTYKDTFLYNSNDLLAENIRYSQWGSPTLTLSSKESFNYDVSGNLIESIRYRPISSVFQPETKSTYIYDESIPYNQLIIPHQYKETITKLLESTFQVWQPSDSTWDIHYSTDLHYSDVINSVPRQNLSSISLYPNPAQSEVNINGLIVSTPYWIFDLQGKLVKKGKIEVNEGINLTSVSNGMYVFKVGNKRLKLIVEK